MRVAIRSEGFAGQLIGQGVDGDHGIQLGTEEESDRQPLLVGGRRNDPVHRCPQIAVGRQLQQLADIHHKAARQRGRVNPAVRRDFDLQSFLLILQQEAEKAGVLMRANALGALGLLLAGIADQLDMFIGLITIQAIEGILRQAQRFGEGAQQGDPNLGHFPLPGQ